ncbi:MAG TPA: hypothetical protein VN522_07070 [Solirubrobacterales bacterium]|nr:hypothetical protein [Solirubrobacterales bacterium]
MQFTSQAGNITYCPGQIPSWSGKASGAVLSWAGPSLTGCNVSTGGTASITPSGQWSLTASTVSSVALKADTVPSGGTVLTIKQAQTGCIIAVKGPLSLSGLPWNNSTHTFALENSVAIQASGPGFCNGIIGSSMIITGTISIPGETILP